MRLSSGITMGWLRCLKQKRFSGCEKEVWVIRRWNIGFDMTFVLDFLLVVTSEKIKLFNY